MDIFRFVIDNLKRSFNSKCHDMYNFLSRKQQIKITDLNGIIEQLKVAKNVIIMTGAGISTNANIPDFRSESFGLYSRLEKYNLPHPTAVFTLDYFKQNPRPFYDIAHEMYPVMEEAKPTTAHYFIKLLENKGILLRHYTQNIDGLEDLTGLSSNKTVQAHGNVRTGTCLNCKEKYSMDYMKKFVIENKIPTCEKCSETVKPDVVLFGEELPKKFWQSSTDFPKCDLLIILGTSLVVQPFASLAGKTYSSCPKLLINREDVSDENIFGPAISTLLGFNHGFDSSKSLNIFYKGDCDEGCLELCRKIG